MKQLLVALYVRVSTDDHGQDPQNQLLQLRRFAKQQGWTVVCEYVDEVTGKNGNRPAFRRMWEDVGRHRFQLLLFWSLDRFTREGVLPTLQYLRRLEDNGVRFKSYTEQYVDSLGVFGPAIIGILAAVAQQERIRLSERTKAGLSRVRAKGVRLGRPAKPLNVSKARALRARGLSLRAVASKLHVSPALVLQRLRKAGSR